MTPETTMQEARTAMEEGRLTDWPPWEDRLLLAAKAFATQQRPEAIREALDLWRRFAEAGGRYYWGSPKHRVQLLASADGLIPPEFIPLLDQPPHVVGPFTRHLEQ